MQELYVEVLLLATDSRYIFIAKLVRVLVFEKAASWMKKIKALIVGDKVDEVRPVSAWCITLSKVLHSSSFLKCPILEILGSNSLAAFALCITIAGKYSIQRKLCFAAICSFPMGVPSTVLLPASGSAQSQYNEGDQVTYQCQPGYKPQDIVTTVCGRNGQWSPNPVQHNCTGNYGAFQPL